MLDLSGYLSITAEKKKGKNDFGLPFMATYHATSYTGAP